MQQLIDREELLKKYLEHWKDLKNDIADSDDVNDNEHFRGRLYELRFMLHIAKDMPTCKIIKHGHWFGVHDCPTCSECLEYIAEEWDSDYELYPYCPHCGAVMDEPVSDTAY